MVVGQRHQVEAGQSNPRRTCGRAPNESPPWVGLPSVDSVDSRLPTVMSAPGKSAAERSEGPARIVGDGPAHAAGEHHVADDSQGGDRGWFSLGLDRQRVRVGIAQWMGAVDRQGADPRIHGAGRDDPEYAAVAPDLTQHLSRAALAGDREDAHPPPGLVDPRPASAAVGHHPARGGERDVRDRSGGVYDKGERHLRGGRSRGRARGGTQSGRRALCGRDD